MKILVIGGGGREHALAWSLAQSPQVDKVLVAPGNAGTADELGVENVEIAATDIDDLLEFAGSTGIDLTVVGPEAPLVDGIVDRFVAAGLRCFGPTASAARLEGSKAYSKEFMERHGIPTAAHQSFTEVDKALDYLQRRATPIVIKADGLAAGKGVVVARNFDEAESAIRQMLQQGAFGAAGEKIVIEDFLEGEEASFIAMIDGHNVLPLATSQDHKARDDGDSGPNTGGMGAYSPAPVITEAVATRIMTDIMRPTVEGMQKDGNPYLGFLYAGLVIAPDGTAKVLEFNCRLGDPETQPLLFRLKSDLVALIEAALDRRLGNIQAEWDPRVALGVVMTAGGYPGEYRHGDVVRGIPERLPEHQKVFHAGTARDGNTIVTSGGRVLCTVALGNTVTEAQREAYRLAGEIGWRDLYYRKDIGYRAVDRERG
ncbi:MAG: phosphoribosylamine--glycine ligase [Gammaproteobacteria bacterium]|nr:phosphoribosylamine--glycine ligase [Gammaproteobacteria bacterium]